jgi:hypothetical protein
MNGTEESTISRVTFNINPGKVMFKGNGVRYQNWVHSSHHGYWHDDGTAMQTAGGQGAGGNSDGCVRDHIWHHDSEKSGVRWDGNNGINGTDHHEVVWNAPHSMMIKGDEHKVVSNSSFYQNPSDGSAMARVLTEDDSGGQSQGQDNEVYNNLTPGMSSMRDGYTPVPGNTVSNNWNGMVETPAKARDQVRDTKNMDFRPVAGSDVIDAGTEYAPITDGYLGSAPDIGAYEYGDTHYWIPGYQSPQASTPVPPNGSTTAKPDCDLMWLAGYDAVSHDIYFGTQSGNLTSQGNQALLDNIFDPGTLTEGQTYYWRIDTVTAAGTITGDEWSFTVKAPPVIEYVNVYPIEDTGVRDDSPTTNYGSATTLALAHDTDSSPRTRIAYLKFDLSVVPGPIQSAELNVYCTSNGDLTGAEVWSMTDTTWDEMTMTWNDRPALDGVVLAEVDISGLTWGILDASAAVTGNVITSLGMWRSGYTSSRNIATREHANQPYLRIGYDVGGGGNNPPTFTTDPINEIDATEDSAYSSTIADDASDPESDPMTFSKTGGPAWLNVASNGALSGTPANGDVGLNVFTVQVSATGGSDTATLNITVNNTNDDPAFTSDPVVEVDGTEDVAYSSTLSDDATDPDVGDTLFFSLVTGPAWLNIASDGTLSGTPSAADVGLNSWTVQVDDPNAEFDQATLEITVNAAGNNPPAFTSDPINEADATEDAAYSGTIADDASDPESDPMTFSKTGGPAWLNVAANGDLSGTPTNADVGLNVFTVQVDATGGSDTATLNITVSNTNDDPTFTVDPINKPNATEGAAYSDTIAGSATDPDVGDTLTYSKTAGPAWLSVASNGSLSGTPGAGDVGANAFTVEVDDGNGGTDTATLNITVDASGGTPYSQTIVVVDGWDDKNGKTFVEDGKVYIFTSSDDDRWDVEKKEYISLEFSNISFGAGAAITSVTVYCEHYEEKGFKSSDLEWNVGTNWPSSPTTWGTLLPAPVHNEESSETTDSWDVTSYVNSTTRVNDLEFRIKNNGKKKSKPDYIYVTVQWTE